MTSRTENVILKKGTRHMVCFFELYVCFLYHMRANMSQVSEFFAAREREEAARLAEKEAQKTAQNKSPSKVSPSTPVSSSAAGAKAAIEDDDDPYDF